MAQNVNEVLQALKDCDGFVAAAIGHAESGMAMGTLGWGSDFNPEVAVAANSDVIKAKIRAMNALKLKGGIDDILITLDTQYHLIRPMKSNPVVFIYLALDRKSANLAMARFQLEQAEDKLEL